MFVSEHMYGLCLVSVSTMAFFVASQDASSCLYEELLNASVILVSSDDEVQLCVPATRRGGVEEQVAVVAERQ